MGIDISFNIRKKGLFSRKLRQPEATGLLKKACAGFSFELTTREKSWVVTGESLGHMDLELKDGLLYGHVRTNMPGPGYHKAVVDWLDEINRQNQVAITVDDETSYWTNRDFAAMQEQHVDWLRQVMRLVLEQDSDNLAISWPAGGWKPVGVPIYAPLGALDRSRIVQALNGDFRTELAQDFFPWFNAPKDALFYRNMALYMLWNEVRWYAPENNYQRAAILAVINGFEKSLRMDPLLPVPAAAYEELCALTGKKPLPVHADMDLPAPGGFLRGDIEITLPGRWKLQMPGGMNHDATAPDGVRFAGPDGRSIHLLLYHADFGEQGMRQFLEEHKEMYYREGEEDTHYLWQIPEKPNAAGLASQQLHGFVVTRDALAELTLTWKEENHLDWAHACLMAVKREEPFITSSS